MIVDDFRQAQQRRDRKHVLTLLHVLHEPANATKLQVPNAIAAHPVLSVTLKFDVAEPHHVRTSLHQPPAHYREVFGCAQFEAQDQTSFSDVVFQLASLVGAEPAMQCVRKASRASS